MHSLTSLMTSTGPCRHCINGAWLEMPYPHKGKAGSCWWRALALYYRLLPAVSCRHRTLPLQWWGMFGLPILTGLTTLADTS